MPEKGFISTGRGGMGEKGEKLKEEIGFLVFLRWKKKEKNGSQGRDQGRKRWNLSTEEEEQRGTELKWTDLGCR